MTIECLVQSVCSKQKYLSRFQSVGRNVKTRILFIKNPLNKIAMSLIIPE